MRAKGSSFFAFVIFLLHILCFDSECFESAFMKNGDQKFYYSFKTFFYKKAVNFYVPFEDFLTRRAKRQVIEYEAKRWPRRIPYEMDPSFGKKKIVKMNFTCFKK